MITVIFALLSALYDNGKRFEDHTSRFVFRAIVVALISLYDSPQLLVGGYIPYLKTFALNTAIFYAAFDYTLNILEGRKWNYIGQTAKTDVLKGKIQNKIPHFDLISKTILLTITIFIQ
jgi:hypothetical protein